MPQAVADDTLVSKYNILPETGKIKSSDDPMYKEFFEQQSDQMDNGSAPGYNEDGTSAPQKSGKQMIRAYHGTPAEFDHFRPGDTNVGIHFGTSGQAETRLRQLGSSGKIIEADLAYENLKPLQKDEFASPYHPYGFAERILEAGDFTDAEKTYVREHGGDIPIYGGRWQTCRMN